MGTVYIVKSKCFTVRRPATCWNKGAILIDMNIDTRKANTIQASQFTTARSATSAARAEAQSSVLAVTKQPTLFLIASGKHFDDQCVSRCFQAPKLCSISSDPRSVQKIVARRDSLVNPRSSLDDPLLLEPERTRFCNLAGRLVSFNSARAESNT